VMTFVAPSTRREVLRRMRTHLRDGGRIVVGFGARRGYDFGEFLADAEASGLVSDLLLSTWDLRPFTGIQTFSSHSYGPPPTADEPSSPVAGFAAATHAAVRRRVSRTAACVAAGVSRAWCGPFRAALPRCAPCGPRRRRSSPR
jgi:hypothetical protein